MTKKIFFMILVLVFFVGCGQKEEVPGKPATKYLNLDFEDSVLEGYPNYWNSGGIGYKVDLDREIVYSGKVSLSLERTEDNYKTGDYCVATTSFPAADARGKKLRYSGFIKTEGVSAGFASLWWRADSKEEIGVVFDNMRDRGAVGTQPWKDYVIELDIPAAANHINFGVLLGGNGKAWFDHLRITLDGKPYKQVKPKPVLPKKADLAWIRANAIPFESADPNTGYKELMPLKEMIGSRRIVLLGQCTRGIGEFFRMTHRLTRFLTEEMGFTFFAMEVNMPGARRVNNHILTGQGDPQEVLAGLSSWAWDTAEMLGMIKWMREYNSLGKGRIEFFGFDTGGAELAMASVTDFVKKAEPGFLETVTAHYKTITGMRRAYREDRDYRMDYEKWYGEAQKVFDHLKAQRETYLKSIAAEEVAWAIRAADIVIQTAEVYIKGKRSRDRCMADNLEWLLARQPAGTKVITWANNLHIGKDAGFYPSMGSFLHKGYGEDMIVFGFAFHDGQYTASGTRGIGTYGTSRSQPGSVEWFLKESGIPNMILDIRNTAIGEPGSRWLTRKWNFRGIGSLSRDYAFRKQDITKQFDALIYFEQTTPTDCFQSKDRNRNK